MRYDVVIVGGGTAGAILAARLTESGGRRVCLIEAGADYASVDGLPPGIRTHRFFQGIEASADRDNNDPAVVGFPDWGYTARLTRYQPAAPLPRGKVVGGSSSVNGGIFFHPLREDLDEWAAAGNPSWAFGACAQSLTRVETDVDFPDAPYHGSAGPIPVQWARAQDWAPLNAAFHTAARELGFDDCPDFNRPGSVGVGPIPVNIHDRVRYSSAVGYLMPAHNRPNLTILGGTTALGLAIQHGRVVAVEVERDGTGQRVAGDG